METINPKSMFTKGQTAYSIALLSYKDDETEKIITHTISKVGRSFVYDEKETKYHYSNKYKAFISADAFHHQQAIFPTEKAVQEYLERSRLYFDLIRLNSYDWDDLTLAELRSVGEIILKDHKKAFVKNPTVEEINHAETLSKNVPDGEDADHSFFRTTSSSHGLGRGKDHVLFKILQKILFYCSDSIGHTCRVYLMDLPAST